jgi:hypothetical protein
MLSEEVERGRRADEAQNKSPHALLEENSSFR